MILKVCSSQSESGLSVWSLLTAQRFGQVKPMTAAGRAWRRVLRVFLEARSQSFPDTCFSAVSLFLQIRNTRNESDISSTHTTAVGGEEKNSCGLRRDRDF